MKILIDARLYGLENAGLGRYTLNLIEELKNLDWENKYTILLRKKYFNTLKFPNNWNKVLFDTRHYGVTEQFGLLGIISKEKPDIIHSPHYNAPIFTNIPLVTTIHDLLMSKHRGKDATTLTPAMYYFKYFGSKITYLNAIKRSKSLIVPSIAVKKEIVDAYSVDAKRITVTHEGLDNKFKVKGNNKMVLKKHDLANNEYLLYVGNTYPHKNIDKVIDAVRVYNKKNNEKLKFVICSSRDVFTKNLIRKVREEKFVDIVKVLGFVPDKDLVYLYKNSLAFIYASISEGFGLQGLEAMATGTILLASNIPVFKEIYKNNAIYFNPKTIESIVGAIKECNDMKPELRRESINKAQEFTRKYSWTKMAKSTLEVYEKVYNEQNK